MNIQILDLDSPETIGTDLLQLLNASREPQIEVRMDELDYGDPGQRVLRVQNLITEIRPALIMWICPGAHNNQFKSFFQRVQESLDAVPSIVVTDTPQPDNMFDLLELGVVDFITPPLREGEIWPRIWRILGHQQQTESLEYSLKEHLGLMQIIGQSPAFLEEVRKIPIAAKSDVRVLITGSTGTGKELFARAVHYLSPRAEQPFVPVHCGSLPGNLLENELFGHTKGAYTGAISAQRGLIHQADGGTLFLDDVDCLPKAIQIKLLRFLQEKEYRRLGAGKLQRVDVRVIAATNVDLAQAVSQGRMREDLYYRLNVIPLQLPDLRQREEDILLLGNHFLHKYAREFEKPVTAFTQGAKRKLLHYHWPGNVRELEHIVERAVLFAQGTMIRGVDITVPDTGNTSGLESFKRAKARVVEQFEKSYIKRALLIHDGNISRAARASQKNRRAFWELMRKHKIEVQNVLPE